MKLKSFTLFISIVQMTLLVSNNLTAQVFISRDSIKTILSKQPGKIEIDIKSENNNYLIAFTYASWDFDKIYLKFYFDKNDFCIKQVRYIPNYYYENEFRNYKYEYSNRIVDLSEAGIRYAWYTDDSKKIVGYFDPISSYDFETHFAITFEPYSVFNPDKLKTNNKK